MKTTLRPLALAAALCIAATGIAWAHCEIPCGIYGDQMRVEMLREHATTIEKSMSQIVAVGKASPVNQNAAW